MSPDGLVYYPDSNPGIRRQRRGRGFSYIAPDGTRIDSPTERKRLESLAVPPAYVDVWISPRRNGHLQATGRDTRERKQYRYHPIWTEYQSSRKYSDLPLFGHALPAIRRHISAGLRAEAGSEDLAIASVIALIDRLSLRIGHTAYAEENDSYGATTLQSRHVTLKDGRIELDFTAKGGKPVHTRLYHRSLHRALQQIDDLPGGNLLSWVDDDGAPRCVTSDKVNERLSDWAEVDVTAKTFRTWNGSLAGFRVAQNCLQKGEKLSISDIARAASEHLHNTPTIAQKSYIHPRILELAKLEIEEAAKELCPVGVVQPATGMRSGECELLAFLEDAK